MQVEVSFSSFPVITKMKNPVKVRKTLKKHYKIAAMRVGMGATAMMRKKVQGGIAPGNSGMTKEMKGSSKPLVDSGRLMKAFTYKIQGDYSNIIHVGVMRTHASANVARIIHQGASVTVTKKMSILFKVLNAYTRGKKAVLTSERAQILASQSKGIIPALREGTVLNIPPRPFAAELMADPKLKVFVENQYKLALKRTFEELAK